MFDVLKDQIQNRASLEPNWLTEKRLEALSFLSNQADHLGEFQELLEGLAKEEISAKPQEAPDLAIQSLKGMGIQYEPLDLNMRSANPKQEFEYKEVLPSSTLWEATATAFWQTGTLIKIPAKLQMEDPIPLVFFTTPLPLVHLAYIHVQEGASLHLVEACSSDRLPNQGFRAPHLIFRLDEGAKLHLTSYQDWPAGVANFGARTFILNKDSSLHWTDAHTGQNHRPSQLRIIANDEASIHYNVLAFAANQDHLCLTFPEIPGKVQVTQDYRSVTYDQGQVTFENKTQATIKTQGWQQYRTNDIPDFDQLTSYLKSHDFDQSEIRALLSREHLEPYLSEIPVEYRVEIMARML